MNLSKAKDYELIAEMKRRRLISDRTAACIINRLFGIDAGKSQAERWVRSNEVAFLKMEKVALEMLAKGKKSSSRLLVETIRSGGKTRIPNEIAKHLNRMLLNRNPKLEGLFKQTQRNPSQCFDK